MDRFLAGVERRAFRMAEIATSSREDALDIVQDAMLKLATTYAHKGEDEWGPLFHRILQSKIKDWYRRTSVRNRWRVWLHGRRDEEETQADPIQACKDEAAIEPPRQVSVDDATAALEREIQRLPMRQRQVLMLRLWEGLDVAATAKAMGCSQGSVKSHYSRAVHSLRDKLGDHW
ncbi:MAG: RNA polymerase sigma factor [Gammaproteobacteria bacterium]|nr:MAG: RNA polymerase sigma factor [Gammaproteobacteria bacterium]